MHTIISCIHTHTHTHINLAPPPFLNTHNHQQTNKQTETVLASGVVNNVVGRARAWVRIALNMKALESSLRALLKHHRPVRICIYDYICVGE